MSNQYPNHAASTARAGQSMKTRRHIRARIARLAMVVGCGLALLVTAPARVAGQARSMLAPVGKQQFFDNSGNPLNAGLLYTYVTGSVTPETTFTDSTMVGTNTNPIVLDSAGRCLIYLNPAVSYKFVLKTSAGVTLWTVDPVTPVNASNVGLGEFFNFGGASNSPVTSTVYTSGATMLALHPGSAMWNVDTLNIPPGVYKIEGDGEATAGTLTCGIMNLTDGAPDTPLVTMAFTSTTGERVLSTAVTLSAGGAARNYGIKCKVSAGTGYGWGFKILRVS